jgi:hypothetical protein
VKNLLSKIFNSPIARYFLLAVSLLLIFGANWFFRSDYAVESDERISSRVQSFLTERDAQSESLLDEATEILQNEETAELFGHKTSFHKISLFVYKGDSLVYWNNNRLGLNRHIQNNYLKNKVIKLGNTWLRLLSRKLSEKKITLVTAYVIKREYPFNNEYILNGFDPELKLNEKAMISFSRDKKNGIDIYDFTDEKNYCSRFFFLKTKKPFPVLLC